MLKELRDLFLHDLDRLKVEIELFENDQALWVTRNGINNSGGNLALHLCGNLRHFTGHVIGGSSYERRRDEEFNTSNLSKSQVLDQIQICREELAETFLQIDPKILVEPYPVNVFKEEMTHQAFLFHLLGHLNYHLGQINYYRRIK